MNDAIEQLELQITTNLRSINSLKYAIEQKEYEKHDQLIEISKSIIETLDTFDKVDEWLIEKKLDKNEDSIKTKGRYGVVKTRLINLLKKYGITRIEFPENRIILGLCEVVEAEVDSNRQNDDIISIVKEGYIRGKELIRAAQVIVVKN